MQNIFIPLIYLISPFVVIFLFNRFKIARKVGTVILAYAIGVIMALTWSFTDTTPIEGDSLFKTQTMLQNITVLIAIPLMLFNSDFKLWTKSLPKTFKALISGLIGVVVAVFASFFIFKFSNVQIENMPCVAAMMTGIYTGGTMNYYALGKALSVDETLIVVVLTFQMLITFPFIIFLTAGGFKIFRKLLPFKDENISQIDTPDADKVAEDTFEKYSDMLTLKNFPKMMLGLLLSLGCLAVGVGLSMLLTETLNELVVILTITTLAIALSFVDKIRTLPKTFELGMFFVLIFSVVVASKFNIAAIDGSVVGLLLFVLSVLLFAVTIHLILCRIFKVDGDLFTVAIVGMLCSPPFIPPIVSAMKNKKVLISGITIGLVGYAVGTYLGVGLAYLLKLF